MWLDIPICVPTTRGPSADWSSERAEVLLARVRLAIMKTRSAEGRREICRAAAWWKGRP